MTDADLIQVPPMQHVCGRCGHVVNDHTPKPRYMAEATMLNNLICATCGCYPFRPMDDTLEYIEWVAAFRAARK